MYVCMYIYGLNLVTAEFFEFYCKSYLRHLLLPLLFIKFSGAVHLLSHAVNNIVR